MTRTIAFVLAAAGLMSSAASALPVITTFEGAGATAADIVATRDSFRAAIGGGVAAGANGSFGGLRREINWDGVPSNLADPNLLPADFFNVNSPRGVVFSTPGSGFMVSASAGGTQPTLFGRPADFEAFSAQRLFTAIGSNITDVLFFVPGTLTAATTTAFGLVFTDAETAGETRLEFFDENDALIYSHDAPVTVNQGLSFLGATVTGGSIKRVRITSGLNTLLSNGVLSNPTDDIVVMDDFLYAEPAAVVAAVPLPSSAALAVLALALVGLRARRPRPARQAA